MGIWTKEQAINGLISTIDYCNNNWVFYFGCDLTFTNSLASTIGCTVFCWILLRWSYEWMKMDSWRVYLRLSIIHGI